MDFFELLFTIIIPGIGYLIVIGIAVGILYFLSKIMRSAQSREASKGHEALMAMENMHTQAQLIKVLAYVCWPVAIIGLVYLEVKPEIALLLGTIVFGGIRAWSASKMSTYNASFKDNVVKTELSKVLENLRYEPAGMIEQSFIRELNFFARADRMSGNDLIVADYKGIHFTQCDLRVEEEYEDRSTDSDGNSTSTTRWRTIFQGRVMKFDFADSFRGLVQVVRRDFEVAKVKFSSSKWEKVETELDEFNKLFEVYAEDPLDAMAVLTPQMIEGIFYLSKALNFPSDFYFEGKSMLSFMEFGRDTFDVSLSKTVQEEQEFLKRDVAQVTGFIDAMYFKAQEGSSAHEAQPNREETSVAERAAAIAAVAGPSTSEELKQSAKQSFRSVWNVIAYTLIAITLVCAVHVMIVLPDTIVAGSEGPGSDAMEVSTIWYVIVGGAFSILGALTRNPVGYLISLCMLGLHYLFFTANVG